MKLKTVLFSTLILTGLLMSAFALPAPFPATKLQNPPAPTQPAVTQPVVTIVPPTVIVITTPGVIPVTGVDTSTGLWTLVLFGLLALLGIAFLVALFSPRATHDHIDRNPPPDV
jgi:hypothetical protein